MNLSSSRLNIKSALKVVFGIVDLVACKLSFAAWAASVYRSELSNICLFGYLD